MVISANSPNRFRLIVFDLDGTLIDSAADLCAAINAMLVHYDKPPLPDALIAGYIGDGATMLVRRALGDPEDASLVEDAHKYFLDYYQKHKLDRTRLYPGVVPALEELGSGRDPALLAVLTNKPVGPARAIADGLKIGPYFFRIYGGNSFSAKKPDPEGLRALIEEAGSTPESTVMIGDSAVDILAARNAGAKSIACSYGLAPDSLKKVAADRTVASPEEWPAAIACLGEC